MGPRLMQKHQELRPDLTTVEDIVMPKMDGVAGESAGIPLDATAKVVMVSAVDQREKEAECVRFRGRSTSSSNRSTRRTLLKFFEKIGAIRIPASRKRQA